MQLPCRHLLFIMVQQKKDIFSKEIIAQRWTKQYNMCSNAADFVECEHNVEVARCNVIRFKNLIGIKDIQ